MSVALCLESAELYDIFAYDGDDIVTLEFKNDHWLVQAYCHSGSYQSSPSDKLYYRIKGVPGYRQAKGKWLYHELPNSLATQSLIVSFIKSGVNVEAVDDKSTIAFQRLNAKAEAYDICAKRVADWKLTRTLPAEAATLELHLDERFKLMDHQQIGVLNCLQPHIKGYGLWFKPGVGKTATGITLVCNLALRRVDKSTPLRVLVICPNKVRENWSEEFRHFNTRRGKVTISRGTAYERMATVAQGLQNDSELDYTVIIVGTDTLACSQELYGLVPWDLILCDESHDFITTGTARWKALKQIRESAKLAVSLTGTPQRNTCLDLYAQFEFMEHGLSGFQSQKEWKKHYGNFAKTEDGHDVLTSVKNIPFLKEHVARCSMIVYKDEVMNLPEKSFDLIEVELSARQREIYRMVATQLAIEIERDLTNASESTKSMTIQNALVKLLKLSQITGGFINWPEVLNPETGDVVTPGSREYFAESPKISAVMELILDPEKTARDKTIVWCNHLAEVDWVSSALTHYGVDHVVYTGQVSEDQRTARVLRYNTDPLCKVFVGNQQTGGTGLNLLGYDSKSENPIDCDTTHIITLSRPWSAVLCEQSIERGHRKGTRSKVRITDVVVPDSIDTVMRDSVNAKIDSANQMQDLTSMLSRLSLR